MVCHCGLTVNIVRLLNLGKFSCLGPFALIEALLRASGRVLGNDAAGIAATEGVSVTSKLTRLRKVKNAGMMGDLVGKLG